MARVRSESETLQVVMRKLDDARTWLSQGRKGWAIEELDECRVMLGALRGQALQGIHRNPPLIVLSNPPVRTHRFIKGVEGHEVDVEGIISTEAHAILYRHFEDGKPYRHDFEHPTTLMAVDINDRKCVVIESPEGNPIWQDF